MTKLEELARGLRDMAVDYEHEDSDRNKMQHEMLVAIQTALKPLLDAVDAVAKHTAPYDRSLNWKQVDQEVAALREQLSQWRKK